MVDLSLPCPYLHLMNQCLLVTTLLKTPASVNITFSLLSFVTALIEDAPISIIKFQDSCLFDMLLE